jgi:hypothetical protein
MKLTCGKAWTKKSDHSEVNMDNNMRFLRQQDAIDMKRLSELSVTLIGAGSIGSTTTVWLGKMGIQHLTVFDDDEVQQHNWSNQIYAEADIGRPKAEALWDMMERLCSFTPRIVLHQYTDQPLAEVVISAVDSMSSRKTIWKSVRQQSQVKLYLDARMGLETLMVYTVKPQNRGDRIRYTQTLCTDQEALQEPCTARTICYTPLMAASVLCNLVKRYSNGEMMPCQLVLDLATWTLMTN